MRPYGQRFGGKGDYCGGHDRLHCTEKPCCRRSVSSERARAALELQRDARGCTGSQEPEKFTTRAKDEEEDEFLALLETAPLGEPMTAEEGRAVMAARDEFARGDSISLDEVKRTLGLRL